MARKKRYDDGCATAHALDLIGERWALLIIRELIPSPKRFSDIRAGLPGISTNTLTTRLVELEAGHLLIRETAPAPYGAQLYRLTEWGAALEPLIKDIGRWAAKSPELTPGKPMSAASVLLSMRTMFNPSEAEARGVRGEIALQMGGMMHRLVIGEDGLMAAIGEPTAPDVVVETPEPTLVAGLLYGGMKLEEGEAAGLAIAGDRQLLERFTACFPLPDKAPMTAPQGA